MTWEPTHEVPAAGLSAYGSPDATATPLTTLSAGLRLHRIEELGAWARVAADNGWTGWVDGRLLTALGAPGADRITPADEAPSTAAADATAAPTHGPESFEPATVHIAPAATPTTPPSAGSPRGTIPAGFGPPAGSTPTAPGAAASISPAQIAIAVLGVALVLAYLLPWATSDGDNETGFSFASLGRDVLDDPNIALEGRTEAGLYLLQLLYGAIVLGPVASVLALMRQPAAKVVAMAAGGTGIIVVVGRFLIDIRAGFGLGTWVGLAISAGLIALSAAAMAGSSGSTGRAGGW